jgi:hypothetical protein
LNDRGTVGLFVNFPDNHANDIHRIFSIHTNQIIKSRDLIWLNLNYGKWRKAKINIQSQENKDKVQQKMLVVWPCQRIQLLKMLESRRKANL